MPTQELNALKVKYMNIPHALLFLVAACSASCAEPNWTHRSGSIDEEHRHVAIRREVTPSKGWSNSDGTIKVSVLELGNGEFTVLGVVNGVDKSMSRMTVTKRDLPKELIRGLFVSEIGTDVVVLEISGAEMK